MKRKFNPTLLQGNINKKKYFEGWFQKIYSPEHQVSFIIIYGFATGNTNEKTGFIQLHIPGFKSIYLTFPKNQVIHNKHKHSLQFGENFISENSIKIHTTDLHIDVSILESHEKLNGKNTMGNYYLVPQLPCYHAIVDHHHSVSGIISYLSKHYTLNNAIGYLEKNWGTSFPEKYIWMHAFDEKNPKNQMLFSQADINWFGLKFTKHLGYILLYGEQIDFRKLKKHTIEIHDLDSKTKSLQILSTTLKINMKIQITEPIIFKGPIRGGMQKTIEHHNNIKIECFVIYKSKKMNLSLLGNIENIGNF